MLRASAAAKDIPVNLTCVVDPSVDSGIENGDVLLRFANAVCGTDVASVEIARAELLDRLGPAVLVEAAAVAGNFSTNDRVANAIGIPMENFFLKGSETYRKELGIDGYPSARNTPDR